jgi:sulfoxide reductase heme-binding subunit YedZ
MSNRPTRAVSADGKVAAAARTAGRAGAGAAAPRRTGPGGWFTAPWKDRTGKVSPWKTVVLVGCCLPAVYMTGQWCLGEFTSRPLNQAMLMTGVWAVWFLLLSLAVSPARSIFSLPKLLQVRRMLGLAAAAYTVAHLVFYGAMEGFNLTFVAGEIIHRFYLTIGFVAVVGFVVLSLTSTDAAIRSLGRRWKLLHRLIYPIAVLSLWHFFLTQKIDVTLAMLPTGLFLWLMLWRGIPASVERTLSGLLALALLAGAGTIAIEYAWYALATFVPASRVLAANWHWAARGPRPSFWVTLDGLAVVVAALLWRLLPNSTNLGAILLR